MKTVMILSLTSILAAMAFAATPATSATPAQPVATVANSPMAFTLDATYVTKYIWRGFDVLDDKAAFQPSANLALENGLNFNVWSSWAGTSKHDGSVSTVDATEFDYTISYKNTFGEDCYLTDYTVGWRYYDYPKVHSELADMQEGFIELAWPNLIGNGFVPRYGFYQMWSSYTTDRSTQRLGGGPNGGGIHDLGFDYNWTFESAPELPMKFSWDIVYNDGTGTSIDNRGVAHLAEHDWSHILWGLSTSFNCPMTGAKVTPGIWYQTSMEDSVNKNDEFWSGLSYTLTF
ncbi:MAG: hypothetical protein FJ263_04925 [Planctomycetes bacterium]|nr:hypothetical protein [Planctomycetota bacterium]